MACAVFFVIYTIYIADLNSDYALCFKKKMPGNCVVVVVVGVSLNAAIRSMCQECAYEVQHRIDQTQD